MTTPREYWIGIDEEGVARWLSQDPRFFPISIDPDIKCKKVIHVREVTPIPDDVETEINTEAAEAFLWAAKRLKTKHAPLAYEYGVRAGAKFGYELGQNEANGEVASAERWSDQYFKERNEAVKKIEVLKVKLQIAVDALEQSSCDCCYKQNKKAVEQITGEK